jgi:DNA polymerase sigma
MKVTPGEGNAFQLAISAVTSVLQSHLPQSSLTLLGSRSTGLATPMSDLDFSIAGLSFAKDQEDSQRPLSPRHLARVGERSLRIVEKYLRFSATFSKPEFVHARVPLVTSRHLATGLDIQIQTLTPYQSALDYVHSYLAELPSLRPLYIILRHSMEIRNLTTVYDGGLGSYTILMMIVTALKHSSGKFAADDLGGQLLHVLEFYANADLYKHGFSANPPRVFEKVNEAKPVEEREARLLDPQLSGIDHILQRRNIRKPYLLALQDPANDLNDLGKNAYAIKHVQATFKFAHERISNAVQSKSFNSDSAEKGISWSCLDYLVKADYKTFEIARSKLQCCNDEVKKGSDEFKSTEVIRQVLLDRANDAMRINEVEQYGANLARQTPPITPHQRFAAQASFWKVNGTSTSIPPERAGQRENPKAKRRIDSTAHKKAQKENITFKSIILASDTRTDESTHSKVPLDILNEWAPSTDEESKSQDQGF